MPLLLLPAKSPPPWRCGVLGTGREKRGEPWGIRWWVEKRRTSKAKRREEVCVGEGLGCPCLVFYFIAVAIV